MAYVQIACLEKQVIAIDPLVIRTFEIFNIHTDYQFEVGENTQTIWHTYKSRV